MSDLSLLMSVISQIADILHYGRLQICLLKVLAAACKKVFAEIAKQQEAAKRPTGRQSVRKLMNHHGGKNAMKYVGAPKDFDRIAKEFHVDYAFHKTGPGHYLLFFKADQADAIQAAFGKYTEKVMGRSQDRPSTQKKAI